MKILLTGKPKSGKSTLLEEFINAIESARQGFLTKELKNNGERIGFELIASSGQSATLASVSSSSNVRVSRYGVETGNLDKFLDELAFFEEGDLLYIDEIGQMQLLSSKFRDLTDNYLSAPNMYVGTISKIFEDDFITKTLGRSDIIVLDLDLDHNGQIPVILKGLALNMNLFQELPSDIKERILKMSIDYARLSKFTQLGKLFKNTIKYLAEDLVSSGGEDTFRVKGNTDTHIVVGDLDRLVCDCDLFNGRGDFIGDAGECSHIQSVKLKFSR